MIVRRRSPRRFRVFGALVAAGLVLAACTADSYVVDVAGVVGSDEVQPDGSHLYRMSGDRTISVVREQRRIVQGGVLPGRGDLLLAGATAVPWIARIGPGGGPSPDCYWIGGRGSVERDVVRTDLGIRVAIAQPFDRTALSPGTSGYENGVCLNAVGEATSVH